MAKISVIMPVYNGEKFLGEAIDSILNQTYRDFEFIIINDCSSDSTEKIILSYSDERIKYIKNDMNLGVAGSLNRGLDMCCGEYIARMDSDDISLPERFEKQVEFLESNPDVAVCGAEVELFGDADSPHTYTVFGKDDTRINLLFSTCLCHPVVMMRASLVKDYRYDKAFDKFEDYELWTRVMLRYKIDNVCGVLFKYRIHKSQVTQNYTDELMKRLMGIKKNLLANLGVCYTDAEFCAFYDFSIGTIDFGEQLLNLAGMFENIISANNGFFNEKKLKGTFKTVLLNGFLAQKKIRFSQLKKVTSLVKFRDVLKSRIKGGLRKVIKGNV